MYKDINVNVSGPVQPSSVYKTVVLKGQVPFDIQVTEPNTKYVTKHDFDLGGETVTIPEGCLIEFDGGSLNNGTVVLNCTIINSDCKCFDNIIFDGTVNHFSLGWVGKGLISNDVIQSIVKCASLLYVPYGEYSFDKTISIDYERDRLNEIYGDFCHYYRYQDDVENRSIFYFEGCETCAINLNSLVTIKNIKFEGATNSRGTYDSNTHQITGGFDAIHISKSVSQISNCIFYKFKTAISAEAGVIGLHIYRCFFKNQLYAGVSIERTAENSMYFNGCAITNNHFESIGTGNYTHGAPEGDFNDETYCGHGIVVNKCSTLAIRDNIFEYCTGCGIYAYVSDTTIHIINGLYLLYNYFEHCKYTHIFLSTPQNLNYFINVIINGNKYSNGGVNIQNTYMNTKPCMINDKNYGTLLRSLMGNTWFIEGLDDVSKLTQQKVFNYYLNKTEVYNTVTDTTTSGNEWIMFVKPGVYYLNVVADAANVLTLGIDLYNITEGAAALNGISVNVPVGTNVLGTSRLGFFINIKKTSFLRVNSFKSRDSGRSAVIKDIFLTDTIAAAATNISNFPTGYISNGYRIYDISIKRPLYWNGTKWLEEDGAEAGVLRSGATTDRPVGSFIYLGFMYMDTTLSKPIYASAISGDTVTWVDATGATV